MKQTMHKILAITTLVAVLLTSTLSVAAEDTHGDGDYTVTISNAYDTSGTNTGVSIAGDVFHAYQVFIADNVTSYSVTDDFRGFFAGTKTGDDGSSYNFQEYLITINLYEAGYEAGTLTAEQEKDYLAALDDYNQLAGKYMDSYGNNMYALAVQFRTYLDTYGAHNVTGGITCMAHATATYDASTGYEYAVLAGLDTGYYFIFDQESTANGLGVSASGSFIPLTTGSDYYTTVSVKQSIPTMNKNIYHDDAAVWDIVGDSQIGDTVEFRIISTMPSNLKNYTLAEGGTGIYNYTLTDVMSAGLTYDYNVKVYTDADRLYEVGAEYLDITQTDSGFSIKVDVLSLWAADSSVATLYTFYSATLNQDAVVASDYDDNTATLEYSTNPYDDNDSDSTDSQVFHFTFALDVIKEDESGNGLAGARFGLFDVDGNAIPLKEVSIDLDTGVVYYAYDESVPVISDGGYITTQAVETNSNGTVTGQFQIYGLNDQTYYTLREVEAPDGYNTSDAFDIYFTVEYDSLGTTIKSFTDGSAYVYTSQDNSGDWSSTSTIINRLKIYLPSTGGVGTVLFQVGGGALMLGAVAMLFVSRRKKEEK